MDCVDLVIEGGTVCSERECTRLDIAVDRGLIVGLAPDLRGYPCRKRLLANDCLVLPGVIDAHVHFGLKVGNGVSSLGPLEYSKLAVLGGITTVIDFLDPLDSRGMDASLLSREALFHGRCYCNYGFHATVTDRFCSEPELTRAIELGCPTVKVFTAYGRRGLRASEETLATVLTWAARETGGVWVHAEDDDLIRTLEDRVKLLPGGLERLGLARPPEAEARAFEAVLKVHGATGGRLHFVHLSSADALAVFQSRSESARCNTTAETCPHYLLLDDHALIEASAADFTMTPPLRPHSHHRTLWKGLADGEITCVTTDSCAFPSELKHSYGSDFTAIPMGVGSVELLLPLMFTYGVRTGRLSLPGLVSRLCGNPAVITGLGSKGAIAEGFDADIVVFDPNTIWTVKASLPIGYRSTYEGLDLAGVVRHTVVGGSCVVENSLSTGLEPLGKFVARQFGNGRGLA